ncbi:hypothetical protein [Pararhizobium arenae]|uniref:hypothetical protein n=1 Tax=Pararhizobium arenae TaxID=1856850 RepID=UPI00094AA8BD|nr:hypothetical protein [Pararhizobium arenae]
MTLSFVLITSGIALIFGVGVAVHQHLTARGLRTAYSLNRAQLSGDSEQVGSEERPEDPVLSATLNSEVTVGEVDNPEISQIDDSETSQSEKVRLSLRAEMWALKQAEDLLERELELRRLDTPPKRVKQFLRIKRRSRPFRSKSIREVHEIVLKDESGRLRVVAVNDQGEIVASEMYEVLADKSTDFQGKRTQ